MSDLLERMQTEIGARVKELEPALGEYKRLTAAIAALDGLGGSVGASRAPRARAGSAVAPRRPRGRPATSKSRKRTSATATAPPIATSATAISEAREVPKTRRGRGRKKAANTRGIQAVALISEQPGITIPELASKMKVNRTGMYRILPGPELEGKIRREGSGWWPVGGAAE